MESVEQELASVNEALQELAQSGAAIVPDPNIDWGDTPKDSPALTTDWNGVDKYIKRSYQTSFKGGSINLELTSYSAGQYDPFQTQMNTLDALHKIIDEITKEDF